LKFFTYQSLIIALFLVLTACSKTNHLKQVEQLMSVIINNEDILTEEKKLLSLKDYIASNGIQLEIISLEEVSGIENGFRIIFIKGEKTKEFLWQPLNINNVFILLRE